MNVRRVCIAITVGSIISAVGIGLGNLRERNQRDLQDAYTAWCKLEHRTDLDFNEWALLARAGLLRRK